MACTWRSTQFEARYNSREEAAASVVVVFVLSPHACRREEVEIRDG
jgi:hypothetical protein